MTESTDPQTPRYLVCARNAASREVDVLAHAPTLDDANVHAADVDSSRYGAPWVEHRTLAEAGMQPRQWAVPPSPPEGA